MAANFGLVAHAAERHADELAIGCLGDRLAERGLADARGADQAEDRCLDLVDALLHGEILDDPFLDLVQAIVIDIQYLFSLAQILADARLLAPRQADQRLDEIADDGRFGRHRRHQAQLLQLALRLGQAFLAHAGGLDLLVQFLEVGAFLAFAEFLLDRLDLLVQVVLALALFHLALDAATDALFDLQDVDLGFELREQAIDTVADALHLQHFLLLLELERQVGGDGVGQTAGILDAGDRRQNLRRNLLVQLDELVELGDHGAAHRLDLMVFDARLRQRDGGRHENRGLHLDGLDAGALRAFDQHLDGAVGQLEHLQDVGEAADAVEILRLRLILGGGFLGQQQDALAAFHRHFERLDGFRATDEERNDHVREDDHIAQRQQRQFDGFREGAGVRHYDAFEIGMSPLLGGGKPQFKPRFSWNRRPSADRRK